LEECRVLKAGRDGALLVEEEEEVAVLSREMVV
jgi:hypothetical protein